MSFIQRAREAAEAAAAKAHEAADVAAARAQEATSAASRSARDPSTVERIGRGLTSAGQGAREAVGLARRSMSTVIERIDPSTLADLIIRATALQEMTNRSLRAKGSPYRISEISISASIPPGVSFSIGRIDDETEPLGDVVVSSSDLLDGAADDLVLSLDGTTVDDATLDRPDVEGAPGTIRPSSIESDPG